MVMKSQMVLSNVIASMNLNEAWGKKYFNGETLKTTELAPDRLILEITESVQTKYCVMHGVGG